VSRPAVGGEDTREEETDMNDTRRSEDRAVAYGGLGILAAVLLVANLLELFARLGKPGPATAHETFVATFQAVLCVAVGGILLAAAIAAWATPPQRR